MNITVFTSNQPRHMALIETLVALPAKVFAVMECNTLFPGEVQDFYNKSSVMQRYFSHVMTAEREVFGAPRFSPCDVQTLTMKLGDLNRLPIETFDEALASDVLVVFGASYIKGALAEALIERRAVNIHMGASPYYRGSSCNFWALYDKRPEYVGATIHQLSRGLDSGAMLMHCFPSSAGHEAFALGMLAVRSAHRALAARITDGSLFAMQPVAQDKSQQLRYTRNADFTDAVASEYLERMPSPPSISQALSNRDMGKFLHPFIDAK